MQQRSRFHLPYRAWLLIALSGALALSAIKPPHPDDFLWEHILTALALAGLIALEWSKPLSNRAYTLILLYLLLHVLGAHYTYSEVPYDRWSQALFGVRVSDLIGADSYRETGEPRNHYDRLVHFSFGLLILRPMNELVQRWLGTRGVRSVIVAASFLCVFGTLYELLEALYAATMSPEAAEHYNGQQGDMFDAQKDVALNIAGSTISGAVLGVETIWRRRRAKRRSP